MASNSKMTCPIHHHAKVRPHALALWSPDERWTYAEMDGAIAATTERLRSNEIDTGDRAALRLPRGPGYVILLWALWRLGAVAAPVSTRMPIREVLRALQRIGAGDFVTTPGLESKAGTRGIGLFGAKELVVRSGGQVSSVTPRRLDRPATILHTSGSTGEPKAILHSWGNHVYSAKGSNANLPLRPDDRWLLSLPLYHVGGLAVLVRCALRGAAVAIPASEEPLADSISVSNATHVSLVSTQLRRLLESWDGPAPKPLRGMLLGGGPIPEILLDEAYGREWPVLTSYGSTEMASQITTTSPGAPLDDLGTAGRTLPHRCVRIDDDGQILVRGPTLCVGRIDDGAVRERNDGVWFQTGDLGFLDASGRLHVTGRADRQFVSGGENVQPEEVERALENIDGVERAVVVSVPDEEFGRRPVAFVRSEEGARVQDWEAALETVLPRFKIPDRIYQMPEDLGRGRMKVDYERLRDRARQLSREEEDPQSSAA